MTHAELLKAVEELNKLLHALRHEKRYAVMTFDSLYDGGVMRGVPLRTIDIVVGIVGSRKFNDEPVFSGDLDGAAKFVESLVRSLAQ